MMWIEQRSLLAPLFLWDHHSLWSKISGAPPEFSLLSTVLRLFDGRQVVWAGAHFKHLSVQRENQLNCLKSPYICINYTVNAHALGANDLLPTSSGLIQQTVSTRYLGMADLIGTTRLIRIVIGVTTSLSIPDKIVFSRGRKCPVSVYHEDSYLCTCLPIPTCTVYVYLELSCTTYMQQEISPGIKLIFVQVMKIKLVKLSLHMKSMVHYYKL